jgi:hypothetical protein
MISTTIFFASMSTISTRVSKNGQVTYQVKVRRKGQKTQSSTFHTIEDAKAWGLKKEREFDEVQNGMSSPNFNLPFRVIVKRYLDEASIFNRGHEVEFWTAQRWLRESIADATIGQFDQAMLDEYVFHRLSSVKASTVQRELNIMRAVFKHAGECDGISFKINCTRRMGIYSIQAPNGETYIGQSVNVDERLSAHIRMLKARKHSNHELQKVADEVGVCALKTSVLVLLDSESDLDAAEQNGIEQVQSPLRLNMVNAPRSRSINKQRN